MRIRNWQFKPGFWPTLATLILLPVFVALGFWQLDRADQKSRKYEVFLRHQAGRSVDLNDPLSLRGDKAEMLWRPARVNGRFAVDVQILLDNQVVRGEAGYFVFTPFHADNSGAWLLINRGWIPMGGDRTAVPPLETPAGEVMVEGVINDVPAAGLELEKTPPETLSNSIYRVQRINLELAAGLAGHDLLPYILTLAPESGYGFVRDRQMPGSGREINLGYAFQWFVFAVTLAVIYLLANIRKIPDVDD